MAAFFRFKHYPHGPLFREEEVDKVDCVRRWHQFASQEIEELLDEPDFARAVVLAIAEQNSKEGHANEEVMIKCLKSRYYEMLQRFPPV